MKVSDVRYGNFISHEDNHNWILDVDVLILEGLDIEDNKFIPIPLTEEWLLKFGFEYDGYEWFDFKDIGISFKNKRITQNKGDYYNQFIFVDYVHQLQNLYFALTNQELIINGN